MKELRILVVDDHPIYRNGLREVLIGEKIVNHVAVASNGNEAIEQLQIEEFDVMLLDLQMPVLDGVETAKLVVAEFPSVAIIILTSVSSRKQIAELLEMGVGGYLLKGADRNEIMKAINVVLEGDIYLTPEVKKIYDDYLIEQAKHAPLSITLDLLTEREVEVLRQICIQPNTKAIAQKLFVAESTINNHRYNISKKTGLSNSVQLAIYAVREGYFNPKTEKF